MKFEESLRGVDENVWVHVCEIGWKCHKSSGVKTWCVVMASWLADKLG